MMMGDTCHTSKILRAAKPLVQLFLAAALILQPGIKVVHPAQAAAIRTVNTLADTSGGNCSGGTCSLRDAISLSADGDRIEFAVTGTITLTSAITSDKSLTIAGPGADKLTLSGNNTTRVFFFTGDSTKTVSLSGMTIANGYYSAVTTNNIHTAAHLILDHMVFRDNTGTSHGNAVTTQGNLTITDSVFDSNTGTSYGGAVSSVFGDVTISGSTFRSNGSSEQDGGALSIEGVTGAITLTIQQCTFTGNSAYRLGGAIYLDKYVNAEITASQFRANTTVQSSGYPSADGGAIYTEGQLTINQSAFFNNYSAGAGGAIATLSELTVLNSTFYENRGKTANALAFDKNDGSGALTNVTLYDSISSGELLSSIDNVIIKNSLLSTPGGMSCEFVFQPSPANANNLANDTTCQGGFSVVTPEQMNLQLKSSYLLPLAGSLAIDSGSNENCPSADQRNWARPVDGDGAGGAVCDIGAIEATETINELYVPIVVR